MKEFVKKIDNCLYEIPEDYKKGMRVPARIYASYELLNHMDDAVFEQLINVAMLPGIQKYALCMPDGHSGYGFPIGGIAAVDSDDGVISPGGIGFDINCGVRFVITSVSIEEFAPKLNQIMDILFSRIPSGIGGKGIVSLSDNQFDEAMIKGARWAIENGYGVKEDLLFCEENGCIGNANPDVVSGRARERGREQVGSLGSGNHYLEFQVIRNEDVLQTTIAKKIGIIGNNQVSCMIHCGSRGFGHQIATDYLDQFIGIMKQKYHIDIPDRELACAPFHSKEGQAYFGAMNCAINIAFLNRQLIYHVVRDTLCQVFKKSAEELGIALIYDVCHNTAKLEQYQINGNNKKLLVHRKGATRAFTKGMKGIPDTYKEIGQPVLVGGSMQTASYILIGGDRASDAFYSTVHGSGRIMSRQQAKKQFKGRELADSMAKSGIAIKTRSLSGLAEEAGAAYKNIDDVIDTITAAGLSIPVARMIPVGSIKG
jgi:tRNA-splicing ligase RtcB